MTAVLPRGSSRVFFFCINTFTKHMRSIWVMCCYWALSGELVLANWISGSHKNSILKKEELVSMVTFFFFFFKYLIIDGIQMLGHNSSIQLSNSTVSFSLSKSSSLEISFNFRLLFHYIISAICARLAPPTKFNAPTTFLPLCFPTMSHMTQRRSLLRTSIYSKFNSLISFSFPRWSRKSAWHVTRVHKTCESESQKHSIHFTMFVCGKHTWKEISLSILRFTIAWHCVCILRRSYLHCFSIKMCIISLN